MGMKILEGGSMEEQISTTTLHRIIIKIHPVAVVIHTGAKNHGKTLLCSAFKFPMKNREK
jgi:hypothetical protein